MSKKLSIIALALVCSFSLVLGAAGLFKAEAATEEKCLTSVSLTLEQSITVNYFIENAEDYTSAKMNFSYRDGTATKELPVKIESGKAKVSFEGLAPQYMTDEIHATLTLYKGDAIAKTEENDFTVAGYVKDLLALDKADGVSVEEYENMRALAVNLLYYGDEAQKYVAAKNNETVGTLASSAAGLSAEEKALKTTTKALTESEYVAPENNDGQKFRWVGYGARFDNKLGVYFEFIAKTTENLVVKFNDGTETSAFETRTETVGENKITVYKAIKELFALDYANAVTAEAYIGDEKVGYAITYGVKSLTADFESTTNEYALALNAISYGEAAAKYAEKHTCEFIDSAVETTEVLGTTTVNGYTNVATGLKVTGQKLAKVCKFCGKVSDEGETASEIYDIDTNALSGGTIQTSGGGNVPFATARAMGGDFASGFTSKSGAKLTFGLYSDTDKTATVVLKASSGYIVTAADKWGGGTKGVHKTAKTEDMQFNKVFTTALNGKTISVDDEVKLYGDIATGGDNYKILGSFTYVPFVLELKAGYNELTFTADVENSYKDNGGSVSSPRVDSLATYDEVKIVNPTCVNDGETHRYESLTGGENISEEHNFVNEIADSNIKEAANCQHGTLYVKTCEKCGAKSEDTFDDGKKTAHDYVAKAENGEHYLECSVCGEKTDFTSDHIYLLVSATEETAGVQTAIFKCACGAEKTTVSPVIYKDAAIADVVGENKNFRDNSTGEPLGRFSPIVYKYVSGNSLTTETKTETATSSSAAVISACKNNTTGGTYMSYLYGGAGVGYKIYAEKAATVSVTIKAATGWILSTGTWKTGNMQFNKVFKFSVNGTAIPVADSVQLYGNQTGSSVYGEAMANWTYVTIDFKVNAGENDITLISCAPLKDGYEQRSDGNIYAVGGTTALTTRAQLREAMLYFDPGTTGTQSTAQLDSLAFYDLNGAGLSVSAD